jgi:hypothetical protein
MAYYLIFLQKNHHYLYNLPLLLHTKFVEYLDFFQVRKIKNEVLSMSNLKKKNTKNYLIGMAKLTVSIPASKKSLVRAIT